MGFVEITPEREYAIVTEFLVDAKEMGDAEVDDAVIDQALIIVRKLWDAGLAHRDIKPANVMVSEGRVVLIDPAFATIRPSPWRQAVDLANMMIILALRSSPDHVYEQTLKYFSPDDVAEAFASMRSVTIPSQSRSSLALFKRTEGVDIVARFKELAPHRERISLQRWSFRRVWLTVGAVLALMFLISLAIDNFRAGVI
jgi:serine/threonine protein kinase